MNQLFYGDNLDVLRESIAAESVDLIYLDPPFNSQRNFNVLFKSAKGQQSDAQITAFEDSWHWGDQAEQEFRALLHQPNTDVAEMIQSLRRFLKESDMMAYLVMMAERLLELHRVLKPTGSLYLHCDPTASHYLKIVLDTVFGVENFQNEIIWKRTTAHSDTKQGGVLHMGRIHDVILYYAKSQQAIRNAIYKPHGEDYVNNFYRFVDANGRRYMLDNITGPGGAAKGNPEYEFLGVTRYWRYSKERIQELYEQGRIVQTKPGTVPRYKRFLDESPGISLQDIWDDIVPIQSQSSERLGYPTQKPVALLERIISASSNEGGVVMDPFCGCGTAVHAAQKLGRQWIGIDITHLAISLIEKRLKDAFPGITFEVHGTPEDIDAARDLALRDKYQFQWWACSLVTAQPYQGKKKGADGGTDGLIFFQDDAKGLPKKIIVSVKGGDNISVPMIRDLKGTVEREKAQIGLFITLTPPTRPMQVEAAAAGFYESPHSGAFPKIQILTIEGLLAGTESPKYPDLARGGLTFKQARKEPGTAPQSSLFGETEP